MNIKLYVDHGEKSELLLTSIRKNVEMIRNAGHTLTVIKTGPKDKNMKVPSLTTSSGVNIFGLNAIKNFLNGIVLPANKSSQPQQYRPQPKLDDVESYLKDAIHDDSVRDDNDEEGFGDRDKSSMHSSMEAEMLRRSKLNKKYAPRGQPQQPQQQQNQPQQTQQQSQQKVKIQHQPPQQQAPPPKKYSPRELDAETADEARDDMMMQNMIYDSMGGGGNEY